MCEQTVILLGSTVGVTVACQACCARREVGEETPPVHAILRLDEDVGWTECARGHRVRMIRAGRAMDLDLTNRVLSGRR